MAESCPTYRSCSIGIPAVLRYLPPAPFTRHLKVMLGSDAQLGGTNAPKNQWHSRILIVRERSASLRSLLPGNLWVFCHQRVRWARLRDAHRCAPGATTVQEGSFTCDSIASRWGR